MFDSLKAWFQKTDETAVEKSHHGEPAPSVPATAKVPDLSGMARAGYLVARRAQGQAQEQQAASAVTVEPGPSKDEPSPTPAVMVPVVEPTKKVAPLHETEAEWNARVRREHGFPS